MEHFSNIFLNFKPIWAIIVSLDAQTRRLQNVFKVSEVMKHYIYKKHKKGWVIICFKTFAKIA